MLAGLICCVGVFATMRLFRHATQTAWPVGLAWTFLTSTVAGATVWCTHFVAILAYNAGARVTVDLMQTVQSLLIAITGCGAGFVLAARRRGGVMPAMAGGVIGLSIAAMHYVGMLAFRIEGIVRWHAGMVVASVIMAIALSALAMAAAQRQLGSRFARMAPALLVGAILSLHFTGMTALEVIPLGVGGPGSGEANEALALATALVGVLVIAVGGFAYVVDHVNKQDTMARMDAIAATCEQTGFPKRKAFEKHLASVLSAALPGEQFIVVTTKLYHFDDLVDIYGPEAGDFAIRVTAERIEQARKPGFVIARTGRSEFTAIGPVAELENIYDRSLTWRALLAAPITFERHEIFLDPRIGVACFPGEDSRVDNIVQHSRLALARAKNDPLEPVCIYDESFDALAQRRQILADDLLKALENGEFEVYYQPQVWAADRHILGYEALIRWNHPKFGLVSPAEFIPLAEQSGAIVPIGAWVLQTACDEASKWPVDWHVAVNVSPMQMRQSDLPELVLAALVNSGLAPGRLEIELTESLLIEDRNQAQHVLRRIRALGVKLALDDFGTGYSSMDVLRHIPFDKIKLDRSFVQDIESDPQSLAILHAMVELGRSLAIPVLVEGVETERQMAILRASGCRKVQGYLTGKPAPASAIVLGQAETVEAFKQAG